MSLSRSSAYLLALAVVTMSSPSSGAQEPDLTVSVPALSPDQVAPVVKARNHDRWNAELKGKVVRWSGVVIEPTKTHRTLFERLYVGNQLLQLELKEVLCELPVPDASAFENGSTVTFTGALGGWVQSGEQKPRVRFWPVKF